MAGNEAKSEDNILSNLIGSIILQIKPYSPNRSSNGKTDVVNDKAAQKEIEEQISAKMAAGIPRSDATAAVYRERMDAIVARLEASQKKEEMLPKSGAFRWLRRNGKGGEAAKQPVAMKK